MGSPAVVSITDTRAVGPAGPRPAWAASVALIAARAAAAHCTASSSQAVFIYHGVAILILSVGLHPSQRWAVPWLLAIDNSSLPRLAEARASVGRLAPAFPGACQQRSPSAPQGLARQEGPGGWGYFAGGGVGWAG